ncbi:GTP-binding protein rhoA [Penicillium cataractarum]|uniref:GTP-binding protein rhoA n=1 Tax=Penicillium cataractarum TaxID=2100454 RepID=A0A9W9VG55_9EURO|nr:GTP-binding protein rhoA [Penicillium cataractarum]KAJ5378131.1 GTP-binding protein rhoA [Penicillium cataractarum]
MSRRKVTVDGMSACGKTRLITVLAEYATAHYHGKVKPREEFVGCPSPITSIDIQTPESRSIDLWEVSYSSFERLTVLAYPKTNLVLFCFALDYLDDAGVVYDVQDKVDYLISKKSHKPRDAPLILVGCRNDLRKQQEAAKNTRVFTQASQELRRYAKKNHVEYFECSAESQENIAELLRGVIRILFLERKDSAGKDWKTRSSKCIVL